MKKIIILTLFVVITTSLFSQKIELKAKVDERCELLSTVFRLAEANEYMFNMFPAFLDSVDKYFEPYKNHKVIEYCKIYREKYGIYYHDPMELAIHLQIIGEKISLIPNVKENSLDSCWNRDSLPRFIELLNDFYTTTKFHDFFQMQTIREKVETVANKYFEKIDMEWFRNFFGEVPEGSFNLVISLSNAPNNYGIKVVYLNNKEDLYAITICASDSLNNPIFKDSWALELIIHEFCHSFCNHLIDENYSEMKEKADDFFALREEILRNDAYTNSLVMLYEILVRACVIKYFYDNYPINTKDYLSTEVNNGFIWIEELYNSFGKYEENRDEYPTLRSFMPEIINVLNKSNPEEINKKQ